MVGSDPEAIPVAREALEIADELGLKELRAYALNMIGSTRVFLGDPGGIEDLEQALVEALSAKSPTEIIRAYSNLGSNSILLGDLERGFEYQANGLEMAERFGNVFRMRWLRVERAIQDYMTGEWDDALRAADAILAEIESGFPHYMGVACRGVRGTIRVARGDIEAGLGDTQGGLNEAEAIRDPQMLYPALSQHAAALALSGRLDEAARVAEKLLEEWRGASRYTAGDWIAPLASTLSSLGQGEKFLDAARSHVHTRWLEAAELVASREWSAAAEIYAAMGILPDEADARLRSGRESEIRQALQFYRSVGATRYIEEGEALLAATA
jgi:tetratricopeptide (TPR) repeat protein